MLDPSLYFTDIKPAPTKEKPERFGNHTFAYQVEGNVIFLEKLQTMERADMTAGQ